MTIKTFDANRVGGGTFQLEQDATGAYKIKEVGFVKLPDLKLPEIAQAAYTAPPSGDDDDTTTDPCPPGFKLIDGVCQRIETSGGGGGGGDRLDLTGAGQLENIQKQATTFAGQDTGIVPTTSRDRTDINEGAIKVEGLREKEAYNKAVANYNAIAERNRDLAMGRQPLSEEDRLQNKVDIDAARNEMNTARQNYEGTFETIKAAPKIADFSEGPRTVPTGTLTGGITPINQGTFTKESIDKSFLGEEGTTTKKNVLKVAEEKVKKLFDPEKSITLQIAQGAANVIKGIGDALIGPRQVALNTSNKNALTSLGYKTRGELGSSVDSQRIASAINPDGSVTTSPIENVFVGMNRTSAKGDIMAGARKRVSTVQKTIDRAIAKGDTEKAKRFQERKDRYNAQIAAAQKKKQEADLKTGGVAPGASGGGGGSAGGGKSIVCTAMYQTTGLQDWAKAMKIWYIYQKRYLTIQHQEGYHKLFKPFVKGMHKSNIIKAIGAHFAKHRTQHLKHVMFNSKPSLLGKIYNKVLEPICYWAGRK